MPADELAAGEQVGEFRIERKLREGGMATVYAAVHATTGLRAAVKIIRSILCTDAASIKRFIQEARVLHELKHPNIVGMFSLGRLPDGRVYYVMERLEGETLGGRLRRGRLALGDALDVLEQMCDALAAAHEHGVVHRDLKPDNVFLVSGMGARPVVQLLDFGIAKLLGDRDQRLTAQDTEHFFGTPHYVAPEQARGRPIDARADVYSLGIIAFEMVLGRKPFVADNAADLLLKHLGEAPPHPRSLWPGIPRELDRLIVHMLAKDGGARPTIDEVRKTIAGIRARTTATRLAQSAPVVVAVKPRARWRVFAAAGGVLAIAAVATAVWLGRRDSPGQPAAAIVAAAPPAAEPPPAPPPPSRLSITVEPVPATVEIDGRVIASGGRGAEMTFPEAGEHTVVVSAPAYRPWRRTVRLERGAQLKLPVSLDRKTRAQPARPRDPGYTIDPFAKKR